MSLSLLKEGFWLIWEFRTRVERILPERVKQREESGGLRVLRCISGAVSQLVAFTDAVDEGRGLRYWDLRTGRERTQSSAK